MDSDFSDFRKRNNDCGGFVQYQCVVCNFDCYAALLGMISILLRSKNNACRQGSKQSKYQKPNAKCVENKSDCQRKDCAYAQYGNEKKPYAVPFVCVVSLKFFIHINPPCNNNTEQEKMKP